jgi:hypothetical protein
VEAVAATLAEAEAEVLLAKEAKEVVDMHGRGQRRKKRRR